MGTTNDQAGLLVILDAAGRTILELEQRVDSLTALVAQVTAERDQLHHLLAEVRASECDAEHVPPGGDGVGQDGAHAAPDPAP